VKNRRESRRKYSLKKEGKSGRGYSEVEGVILETGMKFKKKRIEKKSAAESAKEKMIGGEVESGKRKKITEKCRPRDQTIGNIVTAKLEIRHLRGPAPIKEKVGSEKNIGKGLSSPIAPA